MDQNNIKEVERIVLQKLPLLDLENLASVCQLLSIEVDKNKSGTSDVLLRLM